MAEDSGINVTEGIVIEDNDIKEGIGNNRGNQYVRVPVGNGIKKNNGTTVDITLGRYSFANGTSDKVSNTYSFSTRDKEGQLWNNVLSSV